MPRGADHHLHSRYEEVPGQLGQQTQIATRNRGTQLREEQAYTALRALHPVPARKSAPATPTLDATQTTLSREWEVYSDEEAENEQR